MQYFKHEEEWVEKQGAAKFFITLQGVWKHSFERLM